jgi:hypothetical protein
MFKLTVHNDAVEDLRNMVAKGGKDKLSANRIVALLQEIKDSQEILSELTTHGFETDDIEIGKYLEFWNNGTDLWKIKFFDFDAVHDKWKTIPYRVIYAYDLECQTFRVLGVVPRSFNYDPNHALTKRIIATYDNLGLPRHVFRRNTPNRHK